MDNGNTKQKIITQIVCILLSTGLWFYVMNIENPIRTIDISKVPVEILNTEGLRSAKLALSPNQNFYVNLKVEGNSQSLGRINKNDFKIVVDLSEYALKKGENKIPVNILDYPSGVSIKSSTGLTISINIEEFEEKEVGITSKIDVEAADSFYAAPIVFTPETVVVSGPKSLVEKVNEVIAEGTEINVDTTINKSYYIKAIDVNGKEVEGIELSNKYVEATIGVNGGKHVPITLNTRGQLKAGLNLVSINLQHKDVLISGPDEILSQIAEINTENLDLSSIENNETVELKLIIPEGIKISLSENKVMADIIVEKMISKELSIKVNIIGLEEGLTVVAKGENVKVKISGYQKDLDEINENNLKAELNLSEYKEAGEFSELPKVTLTIPNENVQVEVLDKISFEITKKENIVE